MVFHFSIIQDILFTICDSMIVQQRKKYKHNNRYEEIVMHIVRIFKFNPIKIVILNSKQKCIFEIPEEQHWHKWLDANDQKTRLICCVKKFQEIILYYSASCLSKGFLNLEWFRNSLHVYMSLLYEENQLLSELFLNHDQYWTYSMHQRCTTLSNIISKPFDLCALVHHMLLCWIIIG